MLSVLLALLVTAENGMKVRQVAAVPEATLVEVVEALMGKRYSLPTVLLVMAQPVPISTEELRALFQLP